MHRKKIVEPLVYIVLILVLLAPRLKDLAKFTAADEPFWLVVGANYYYALTHREFENTVYEYHPAVTTMWIVTGAMLIYFPEYRGLMDGYFHQEKGSFDAYLPEHDKNPLELLWWSRFLQVLLNVSLLVILFFLLSYMLDKWTALAVVLFASFAPYLFGQSRMLNHESMVGLFSMVSILSITGYLFRERKPVLLFLSAGAAAGANLTKSSSIFLLPTIGVIIFVWAIQHWKDQKWLLIGTAFKIFFAWLGMLIVVYVIAWPGMWVAPGKMLYEVYGNAFSYAFQGARLSVTQGLDPSSFSLDSAASGILGFLISMAWRTTPISWLGLLLAIVLLFNKNRNLIPHLAKLLLAFLILEALVCIAMFGVAQGRNQPHYVLAAYYGLEFAAGLGWVLVLNWLASTFASARKQLIQAVLFAVVLGLQAAALFYTFPYYYTYRNPIMTATSNTTEFFYGERMEEAAAYLAAKPYAENLTALVYFGRSFDYYFPGRTLIFKPVMFTDKALLLEDLRESDYLVMYVGLHERFPLLKELTPEKIIDLNGRQYVEIYRVSDIPASFFTSDGDE